MYHIVEGKFCRCGRLQRSEQPYLLMEDLNKFLSCNAVSDHGIVWIQKEGCKIKESASESITTTPKVQRLERLQSIKKEHEDAQERAVSFNVPHAVSSPSGTH